MVVNDEIVTQLLQGQRVLEIYVDGKWSQVITLDDKTIDRTVWVYRPLLESQEEAEASETTSKATGAEAVSSEAGASQAGSSN